MLGYEAIINGMVLSRNMKNGYLVSGLIAGGSGIVLVELLLLMTREHYLDQQAYLVQRII